MKRLRLLLGTAGRDLARLWYACRHPATPTKVRAGALLLLAYVISPIDLLPEWIPLVGIVDDITLAALAIPLLMRMVPDQARLDADRASDNLLRRFAFWRG